MSARGGWAALGGPAWAGYAAGVLRLPPPGHRAVAALAWWRSRSMLVRDGLLGIALALLAFVPPLAAAGTRLGELPHRPVDALAVTAVLAQSLPLAVRRRWPAACLAVVAGGFAVQELRGYASVAGAGLLVAVFSAGAHQERLRRTVAAAAVAGYAALAAALHAAGSANRIGDYVLFFAFLAAGWLGGAWLRGVRAAEAQRRRAAAAAARTEERARIARELHDVITHHVTAMVVQADAAQYLTAAPDKLTGNLTAISGTGRRALGELRDLLGVLDPDRDRDQDRDRDRERDRDRDRERDPDRDPDRNPGRDPDRSGGSPWDRAAGSVQGRSDGRDAGRTAPRGELPTLAKVGELVARTRAAGQPVELVEDGHPGGLGAGREMAAYRVVQEALTNALKYAAGCPTVVRLQHRPDGLRILVTTAGDDAPGPADGHRRAHRPAAAVGGGGRGLAGLRDRVEVFGGELSAGPGPAGGFVVDARIPAGEVA
ncbi:sensor histidine kinase [Dactylosporangium sucinum]|uniref:histidine kinase n=1 Tax=Dactylosporangium sucinum TaxID=1424081 RepID=A0A917X722_9ACTN|nr:histidine kinase [Dactylosporangium sucinum]GGM88640.1 two-component sensor histidine kinase [Dactylosporangium sucinum]